MDVVNHSSKFDPAVIDWLIERLRARPDVRRKLFYQEVVPRGLVFVPEHMPRNVEILANKKLAAYVYSKKNDFMDLLKSASLKGLPRWLESWMSKINFTKAPRLLS